EDSHVKTVSLARGTVATPPGSAHSSAAQTPLASATRSDDVSRRFQERSSLGRSQSPAELMKPPSSSGGDGDPMSGILSQIGVTELLEQDDRPTFVVDLADSGNYGPGQLNLVFANSSLKSYAGMQELVNGAAGDASCSPGSAANTFLQFKSWLLSASVNGESLNCEGYSAHKHKNKSEHTFASTTTWSNIGGTVGFGATRLFYGNSITSAGRRWIVWG
ncbi:hypothetical protein KC352_g41181, partial [Hortaea werneckii]